MSEIVWEEPPQSLHHRNATGLWESRLAPLLKHPGKWAMIGEKSNPGNAAQTAQNLRRRSVRIPSGRWEFTSRKADNGKGKVYARYLGPEE